MIDDTENLAASRKLTQEQKDLVELRRAEREEVERTYDLTRLIEKEIGKYNKKLKESLEKHEDLTRKISGQRSLIIEQKKLVGQLTGATIKYKKELEDQIGVVSAQHNKVKDLQAEYEKAMVNRKKMGEILRNSYSDINAEENKILKLQEEKQTKEDAFIKLKARNLKFDEIRTKLGLDMARAIQTGNQAEVDAINKKLKIANKWIQFTSDEMDANRASVEMINNQVDASRKLLKEKRQNADLIQKNVDTQGAIMRQISLEKKDAEEKLKTEEELLARRQRVYDVSRETLKQEENALGNMESKLHTLESSLAANGKFNDILKGRIKFLENIKQTVGETDKFLESTGEHYGKTKTLIMDIAKGGGAGLLAIVKASLDRWKELDKAAADFRDKTGFLVTQTKNLDKAAREVNVQMAAIGVSITEAYAAAAALTNEFQVIGLVTKEMIADTAKMAANLGIAISDAAKFRGLYTSISQSAGMTATQSMGAAAALAEMAGVAPGAVLKDMAEASSETLSFLAKSPMALMKATVEARRLGTTVNSLSKSARGFLNYQDSITSELEASALIGKALNFQEARAAAYAGDVVKSRELALKQLEKAGDFTKLNVYQQEALAKAAGMTVDEVIKQQNQQKMLAELRAKATGEDKEMLDKYEAMQKKIAENEKSAKNDLVARGRKMMEQQLRQSEMNKISNAFAAIWTDISDALLPIANAIMPILIGAVRILAAGFKLIGATIRGLLSPFDAIFNSFRSGNEQALNFEKVMVGINKAAEYIAPAFELAGIVLGTIYSISTKIAIALAAAGVKGYSIAKAFKPFTRMMGNISNAISRIANGIGIFGKLLSPFASLFKYFGMFAKFLGPLGLIISAAQVLFDLAGQLMDIWSDDTLDIGDKILKSVLAIPNALFNALISPFIDLGVWVLRKFGMDIPDSMVDGIKNVGKDIFQWTLMPFVKVLEWLKKTFMGNSPSEIGLGIVDGLKAVGSMIMDAVMTPFKAVGEFIFDMISWPFRKIVEVAKKIPIIGKLFGGSDAAASVNANVQSTVSNQVTQTVEIKNMNELKESLDKLTEAITSLGGTSGGANPVVNVNNNSSAVVEKLDELIGLLMDGSIGVNIDGIKASKLLARAS